MKQSELGGGASYMVLMHLNLSPSSYFVVTAMPTYKVMYYVDGLQKLDLTSGQIFKLFLLNCVFFEVLCEEMMVLIAKHVSLPFLI